MCDTCNGDRWRTTYKLQLQYNCVGHSLWTIRHCCFNPCWDIGGRYGKFSFHKKRHIIMRWVRSTEEERKEWGQAMADIRRNKGIKQSPEWINKKRISMLATLKRKKEAGYVSPRNYSRRDPQELALTHIYRQYRGMAKKRGFNFELSKDKVVKLVTSNCSYCNLPPRERIVMISHYPVKFIANGIDRVDSLKSYTIDNCIPCCWDCNTMKNDMPLDGFKEQIRKVYKHLCLSS
jgi:hypothetical protein